MRRYYQYFGIVSGIVWFEVGGDRGYSFVRISCTVLYYVLYVVQYCSTVQAMTKVNTVQYSTVYTGTAFKKI